MKKTISKLVAGMAAMTALGLGTAGQADAAPSITSFNKLTLDLASSTVTGVNSNLVTYTGGGWNSGLSTKWWDPILGTDGNYTTAGEKYGFVGGSFTLSENALVTMKTTAFSLNNVANPLAATDIYLYDTVFNKANPLTNQIGYTADASVGLTQALQAGKTYWMIITTDASAVPNIGNGIVSAEISAATPTPIPAAAWLLGSGLVGLAGFRKRQQ
jgi:hypothetical protein